MTVPSGKGE